MKRLTSILIVIGAVSFGVSAQTYWTKARQTALENVLVASAHNSSWFEKCVGKAGGILKVLDAKAIVLAGSAAPHQFLLTGKTIPNKEACAYGARSPMNWIVEEDNRTFRILADIGAADSVQVIESTNNGYRDIRIGSESSAGREWDTSILRFDGTQYK